MNELLCVDGDLDWVAGPQEPSELIWTADGWSFADRPVASAAQRYDLDSEGCSLEKIELDLQSFFDIESAPLAVFAERASAGRRMQSITA